MTPLVSIIIPAWNAGRWLDETLRSALAQTWPAIEIIVVDDGSTDDTLAIARQFEGPLVRVVTQPNSGASSARNHGLRLARGDYIQFLDADDLLAPDKIAEQLAHPKAGDPAVLFSGAWGRFADTPENADFRNEILNADYEPARFVVTKLENHAMMHPAAWLVSRHLIEKTGPWNELLSLDDDGEYFTRVVLASRRVRFCGSARSFYRSRIAGSLSRTRSESAWSSQFLSVRLSGEHLLNREDSPASRRALADALQRVIYEAYPAAAHERRQAAALVARLGGSTLRYEAGPHFALAARLLGWKIAKRLRNRLT